MGRYFLSSVAEADMLAVWEYIAQDNIAAADRMIDRFTAAFERAAQFPEANQKYQHPKGDFRIAVVAPYLIFYKISDDEIDIVRVLHGARRWEELL
ncbi:MAG: type II toxin-antitoxin system RelE/ParE family toxin [Pirellulales bacterium]